MKKIILIVTVLLLVLFPANAFAEGDSGFSTGDLGNTPPSEPQYVMKRFHIQQTTGTMYWDPADITSWAFKLYAEADGYCKYNPNTGVVYDVVVTSYTVDRTDLSGVGIEIVSYALWNSYGSGGTANVVFRVNLTYTGYSGSKPFYPVFSTSTLLTY